MSPCRTAQSFRRQSYVGQICGLAASNIINSSGGLNAHILNCYGRTGSISLVGSSDEELTTGGLLTDTQLKDAASYKGWSFDGDWKISDDGIPARTDSSDITSLSVKMPRHPAILVKYPGISVLLLLITKLKFPSPGI